MVVSGWAPGEAEVEARGATVRLRVHPAAAGRRCAPARWCCCRDVTEVRRRERELVGKDATIREIHHRVKNNLQTVAALLRLQARRLPAARPAAREALAEAERRVGSIALVHETLSQTGSDERSTSTRSPTGCWPWPARSAAADGARCGSAAEGSFGQLPPEVATPLALVLVELVQNAVEHGLAGRDGEVRVTVGRGRAGRLVVAVADDGPGCRRASTCDAAAGLGPADRPHAGRRASSAVARAGAGRRRRAGRGDPGRAHACRRSADGAAEAADERDRQPGPTDGAPPASAGPPCGRRSARQRAQAVRARLRAVRRLRARRSSSLMAAPDAGVLAGLERPRQAGVDDLAATADGLGLLDLQQGGPVLPIGKNSSGSSSRQAARWRQSMRVTPQSSASDGDGVRLLVKPFTSDPARRRGPVRPPAPCDVVRARLPAASRPEHVILNPGKRRWRRKAPQHLFPRAVSASSQGVVRGRRPRTARSIAVARQTSDHPQGVRDGHGRSATSERRPSASPSTWRRPAAPRASGQLGQVVRAMHRRGRAGGSTAPRSSWRTWRSVRTVRSCAGAKRSRPVSKDACRATVEQRPVPR